MNTERTTSEPSTASPVMPISRKKLSILTSAMMPNGASMKSLNASADMLTTMKRKKAINMYLRLRRGMSSQRGTAKLRRNSLRPSFHRPSEIEPTGQSHEQNDSFSNRLDSRNTAASTIAAG